MGGEPERGLPGHVGAAGCLSTTCGREDRRRTSGDLGTLLGTAGWGGLARRVPGRRAPRAVFAPGLLQGAPGRPALSARRAWRPGPGRSLCPVPALLGGPGPVGGGAGRWDSTWQTRSARPPRPASDRLPSPSLAEVGPPPRGESSGIAGGRGRPYGALGLSFPCRELGSPRGSQRVTLAQIRAIIRSRAWGWGRALGEIQILRRPSPKWQLE